MVLKPDFNSRRYQRYFVNLGAYYQRKDIKVYTSLILSLFTIAFFGVFAIKPTLTTIAGLFQELQEKRTVNQKLQEKINNLNQAQTNFAQISSSIYLLDQALPQNPSVSQLIWQLEILAQKSNVAIKSLGVESLEMQGKNPNSQNEILFNLNLSGDYENLKTFLGSLESLRRVITVNSFAFSQSKKEEAQTLTLNLAGKAYYFLKQVKTK